MFSNIRLLFFSPEMIPLFTSSIKNSLQYFLLTLQLEWTNHCAHFNTYSNYDSPEKLKRQFKNKHNVQVTEGNPSTSTLFSFINILII